MISGLLTQADLRQVLGIKSPTLHINVNDQVRLFDNIAESGNGRKSQQLCGSGPLYNGPDFMTR